MTVPDRTVGVDVRPGAEPSLDAEATAIAVRGPFTLSLRGHETPAHVHCRLDGPLARVATLDETNYYVETETAVPVEVVVEEVAEPLTGTIELTVGFGAESIELDVTVEPEPRPEVDESLADPRREEPEPTVIDRLAAATGLGPATLGVAALGAVALLVATSTAAVVGGTAAYAGLLVVLAGVVVAGALLLS